MSDYNSIAYYYDLSHQVLVEDIPFWSQVAADFGRGQKIDILELGCGSGRLTIPLAQLGHRLTGLDSAAEMIDIGKQYVSELKGNPSINWIVGDMTTHDFGPHRFDLIFIGHNTAMHLPDADLYRCLSNASLALKPGGELMIDVMHPELLLEGESEGEPELEQRFVDPKTGETIELYNTYRFNHVEQVLTMTTSFRRPTESIDEASSMTATYTIRHPHQFQNLFRVIPTLKLISIKQNYPHESDEEPTRLILTAVQQDPIIV